MRCAIRWFRLRILGCAMAMGCSMSFGQNITDAECNAVRARVDKLLRWENIGESVSQAQISLMVPPALVGLRLIKLNMERHQFRVFDLRDLAESNQSRGLYAPPLYALSELGSNLGDFSVLSTAGMTTSNSDPVPTGFLRIDGMTRMPVASRDTGIDAVVCIDEQGEVLVRSGSNSEQTRASNPPGSCISGFQAGPVLVAEGHLASRSNQIATRRIALAILRDGQVVFGYSEQATAGAMACALSAPSLGAQDAVSLQGGSLGGMVLKGGFASRSSNVLLGNTESTIASALVVQARAPLTRSLQTRQMRTRGLQPGLTRQPRSPRETTIPTLP